MSFTRTFFLQKKISRTENLIFYIVTNNLTEIKKSNLVDITNINDFIDVKNNYTALHYAMQLPDDEIIKYLLLLGAKAEIKSSDNQDCYDLSIKFNKRYLFDKKIEDLVIDLKVATNKNSTLNTEINYYIKIIDNYKDKIQNIENENKVLLNENTSIKQEIITKKRKIADLELSCTNLIKQYKK